MITLYSHIVHLEIPLIKNDVASVPELNITTDIDELQTQKLLFVC